MRAHANSAISAFPPQPGTPEAIELGCTCRFIAHESATDELGPAGIFMGLDASCPLHASMLGLSGPTEAD